MSRSRQLLCVGYAAASLLALVGTWRQNVAYVRPDENPFAGVVLATIRFWQDTFVNPASRSITIDLGMLLLPLVALMIIEARRLSIRFVWLYVVFGLLIAISATFPLFLIARERRIAAQGEASAALGFRAGDALGFAVLALAMASLAVWTIVR